MSSSVPVGVIIVTYNSADVIEPCLESLKTASKHPLNVVVVDNASTDGTPYFVADHFPKVTIVRNPRNFYYAKANNQGLVHTGQSDVLLLNPDVVFPVDGVDEMRRILHSDDSIAAVAPRLVDPAGKRQQSLRELPGLDTLWYDLLGLSFLFRGSTRFDRWRMGYFNGREPRDVEQPMASCLLIRHSVIAKIGLFDERYPMFFNDVDWCKRVNNRGWRVRYTPDVMVRHVGGASTRKRKVKMVWMSHAAYYRYLRQYNCRPLHKRIALWLTAPFLWLAAVARSVWWGVFKRN